MTQDDSTDGVEVAAIVLQRTDIPPTALLQDVRFDSLARVILIAEVHDRFGIVVEPQTMDSWVTVADMVAFVDGLVSSGDCRRGDCDGHPSALCWSCQMV